MRGGARDGRHLVGETKCYDCLVPFAPGAGSRGGVGKVGATRALGNTEEELIKTNYGLAARGIGTSPFNHATGAGCVKAHQGDYHDCIHVKHNTLLLLISEIFGGVNGRAARFLTRLAHSSCTASDAVYYDRAGRIVSFHQHHATAISSAAALGHGDVLLSVVDDVNARAVRARAGAPAAAAALGRAEAVTPPRAVVAVAVMPPRAVAAVAFGGVALVAGAIALAGALVPVGAAVRVPAPAVPAPAPPASPPFFAGVVA